MYWQTLSLARVVEGIELRPLVLGRPEETLPWRHCRSCNHVMLDLNVPPAPSGVSLSVDESLHEYLISTAGNAYIKDFFDRQGRYYRLLFE